MLHLQECNIEVRANILCDRPITGCDVGGCEVKRRDTRGRRAAIPGLKNNLKESNLLNKYLHSSKRLACGST